MAEIQGTPTGVCKISILDLSTSQTAQRSGNYFVNQAASQLEAYFRKERNQFEITTDVSGSEFQKNVWKILDTIPYGKQVSYMDIANQMGDPKTIRAVANANAKNPLWIVVPCHRVVGSDGSLTGYAGGLWRKKWLLEHESPVVQQSLW